MKLPFHERYDCESDTTLTRIGGNDGDILIQRGDEELVFEIADDDHKLFVFDKMAFVFNSVRMESHAEFFDRLCKEPSFTKVGAEVRTACNRVMLSDLLWIYAHRPKHWKLPFSREDARIKIKGAADALMEQLLLQASSTPNHYEQTVLVGFGRTTKQGMLNGVPHNYQNITLGINHFAKFNGTTYLTNTKVDIPG